MTRYFRFIYATKGFKGSCQFGHRDGSMPSESKVIELIREIEGVDSDADVNIDSIFEFKSKEDFNNWSRR